MSEISLPDLGLKDDHVPPRSRLPMQEINSAYKACKFGRFHIKLLFTAFTGFVAGVLVSNSTAYLLPSAECDLSMSLAQKGLLNAIPYLDSCPMIIFYSLLSKPVYFKVDSFDGLLESLLFKKDSCPMIIFYSLLSKPVYFKVDSFDGLLESLLFKKGMLLSSVLGGFLTDTFGRKIFIVVGYGGIFVFTVIAGTSQTFQVLIAAKFFEGLLFATSFSAVLTLTSEFCHNEIRDRVLLCQSSFAAIAQFLIPVMAWGILINEWRLELFGGAIVLNTWNFYLYLMSLWSLTACLLYTFLIPESPKFLITKGRYDEARRTLINIYTANTGKPADTYPYVNVWKDKVKQTLHELPEDEVKASFKHQLVAGLHNIKPMFQKPLLGYLVLICLMNFLLMCMYNIIRLWFPQLSTIVEHYKMDEGHDLCTVLDTYTHDLRIKALNSSSTDICTPTKSGAETYINSIILGCVCLLPFGVTGILVNRVGKKPLFIGMSLICVGSILGLRWANTRVAIVALFAVSTAIASVMMSLNQALTMEVFPTTTRTLAIGMMMLCGRIGTLLGNVAFPWLLDLACVVPFFSMSGMMIVVSCLGLFTPVKKK